MAFSLSLSLFICLSWFSLSAASFISEFLNKWPFLPSKLLEMCVWESLWRWTQTLYRVTEWIRMEAHCIGSWLSSICKYWVYGLVLCAFWIWPETLFWFSHHHHHLAAWELWNTLSEQMRQISHFVVPATKILPLFAEERKRSVIWMWKPMWRL